MNPTNLSAFCTSVGHLIVGMFEIESIKINSVVDLINPSDFVGWMKGIPSASLL